ncbi:MAG: response regulator [Chitinophagales bacterium]
MGKRVLVCDDAMVMRLMLKNVLTSNGFEVIGEAKDGKEAIEMYFELRPDIVTMDITMPEIDGIQAVKEIISRDSDARIVMCSAATGHHEIIIRSLNAGAMDFLTKPFRPDQVVTVLERTLTAPKKELKSKPDLPAKEPESTVDVPETQPEKPVISPASPPSESVRELLIARSKSLSVEKDKAGSKSVLESPEQLLTPGTTSPDREKKAPAKGDSSKVSTKELESAVDMPETKPEKPTISPASPPTESVRELLIARSKSLSAEKDKAGSIPAAKSPESLSTQGITSPEQEKKTPAKGDSSKVSADKEIRKKEPVRPGQLDRKPAADLKKTLDVPPGPMTMDEAVPEKDPKEKDVKTVKKQEPPLSKTSQPTAATEKRVEQPTPPTTATDLSKTRSEISEMLERLKAKEAARKAERPYRGGIPTRTEDVKDKPSMSPTKPESIHVKPEEQAVTGSDVSATQPIVEAPPIASAVDLSGIAPDTKITEEVAVKDSLEPMPQVEKIEATPMELTTIEETTIEETTDVVKEPIIEEKVETLEELSAHSEVKEEDILTTKDETASIIESVETAPAEPELESIPEPETSVSENIEAVIEPAEETGLQQPEERPLEQIPDEKALEPYIEAPLEVAALEPEYLEVQETIPQAAPWAEELETVESKEEKTEAEPATPVGNAPSVSVETNEEIQSEMPDSLPELSIHDEEPEEVKTEEPTSAVPEGEVALPVEPQKEIISAVSETITVAEEILPVSEPLPAAASIETEETQVAEKAAEKIPEDSEKDHEKKALTTESIIAEPVADLPPIEPEPDTIVAGAEPVDSDLDASVTLGPTVIPGVQFEPAAVAREDLIESKVQTIPPEAIQKHDESRITTPIKTEVGKAEPKPQKSKGLLERLKNRLGISTTGAEGKLAPTEPSWEDSIAAIQNDLVSKPPQTKEVKPVTEKVAVDKPTSSKTGNEPGIPGKTIPVPLIIESNITITEVKSSPDQTSVTSDIQVKTPATDIPLVESGAKKEKVFADQLEKKPDSSVTKETEEPVAASSVTEFKAEEEVKDSAPQKAAPTRSEIDEKKHEPGITEVFEPLAAAPDVKELIPKQVVPPLPERSEKTIEPAITEAFEPLATTPGEKEPTPKEAASSRSEITQKKVEPVIAEGFEPLAPIGVTNLPEEDNSKITASKEAASHRLETKKDSDQLGAPWKPLDDNLNALIRRSNIRSTINQEAPASVNPDKDTKPQENGYFISDESRVTIKPRRQEPYQQAPYDDRPKRPDSRVRSRPK